MEESIWLYIGILTVLIGIGILSSVFVNYREDSTRDTFFNSVQQLGVQADLVCKAPKETMLSLEVQVPGGALLYTQEDKICAVIDDRIKCVPTECMVVGKTDDMLINLTSDEARKLVKVRGYTCSFRNAGTIEIDCQG